MDSFIKVGIVGGTGYTGIELLRILEQHPHVRLGLVTSRKGEKCKISKLLPHVKTGIAFSPLECASLKTCDLVFFATPHGTAMSFASSLIEAGTRIIDLAADFRFRDAALFEKHYRIPHRCPEILEHAVYGLTEFNRSAISKARIVGNPGCYPTTVLLGVLPLMLQEEKVIDDRFLVADCKSGTSGAGRTAGTNTLHAEVSENFKAYGGMNHRHHPEILAQIERFTGSKAELVFVPHLIPMTRGMFSTLYLRILSSSRKIDFQKLFEEYYRSEQFIHITDRGCFPETRFVRGSNHVHISISHPAGSDQLIVMVAQDNLVKGAAGQAIQNMNLMFNLDETTGLKQSAIVP